MRVMLASMIPWAQFRRTYGAAIDTRELVRRRIGRLAGLIVGCDALVAWCSWLIDQGYRGEMECIVAKIFGSEAQKEAAIELFMKTHGGRAFLHGHLFGDNVHEYLAPCIYEGEGEMLAMAFFKSLVKEHGKQFFEPIGKALQASGHQQAQPAQPGPRLGPQKALVPYARWLLGEKLRHVSRARSCRRCPSRWPQHADFAAERLQRSRSRSTHDAQAPVRPGRPPVPDVGAVAAASGPVVMLATSLYAASHGDEVMRQAADCICQDLTRKQLGKRPSDRYFRSVTRLGEAIADGGFHSIAGLHPDVDPDALRQRLTPAARIAAGRNSLA